MTEAFGTDIGGVLAGHIGENLGGVGVPEIEGAFETLGRLQRERFAGATFVVSMCGEQLEALSRKWLEQHDFFDRTGLAEDKLIYCRSHKDKARIARDHGLTHFVDDRLEVLSQFDLGKKLYLFRPREAEMEPFLAHLGRMTLVQSWDHIASDLLT